MNIIFILFVSIFLTCENQQKNNHILPIIKPSIALFGDSISAFWPENHLADFYVIKFAAPTRPSDVILASINNSPGNYNYCLLNGGVNDFLGNYSPEDEQIEKTMANLLNSYKLLEGKCEKRVFLNTWIAYFPWPTVAALKLNTRIKETIKSSDRLDSDEFINKDHLIDGGHLNEEGYTVLSARFKDKLNSP